MTLKKIRLELARTAESPEGNRNCGYELVAPLDAKGRLAPGEWTRDKGACTVRRFWVNQGDEHGVLVHGSGGRWYFSYRPGEEDDEPLFRLDKHAFVKGEYVSVTEHDGVQRPFRVVDVRPIAG